MYGLKDREVTQMAAGRAMDRCETVEPKRTVELPIALQTLEERIASLEKEHAMLCDRLSVILRSEPAQRDQVVEHAEFSGCTPVTSNIASVTNRVNGLIFRTRAVLDLLEL